MVPPIDSLEDASWVRLTLLGILFVLGLYLALRPFLDVRVRPHRDALASRLRVDSRLFGLVVFRRSRGLPAAERLHARPVGPYASAIGYSNRGEFQPLVQLRFSSHNSFENRPVVKEFVEQLVPTPAARKVEQRRTNRKRKRKRRARD